MKTVKLKELYMMTEKKYTKNAHYEKKEKWLISKLDEIREFVKELREKGEELDIERLVRAINLLAQEEGLRKEKRVQSRRGARTVYEGIKFQKGFIERFLKEHKVI